jgi:hypothetical protein
MKKVLICILMGMVAMGCATTKSIPTAESELGRSGADVSISGLTNYADKPAAGDLIEITDISDTSASANGTSKKVTWQNFTKMANYLILPTPSRCDETGALVQTTAATDYRGQCKFSNSAADTGNYALYFLTVPEDLDTAVDLKVARWKFRLGGADTGKHRYVISMASVADSAAYAGSFSNAINLDFAGDASGADGDVETVSNVTLTSWRTSLTAGQLFVVKVARDGDDGTNDSSTADSYSGPLVLYYQGVQP